MWATPTKPGRPAAGLELIRHAAQAAADAPWFAIGGIDAENVGEVVAAGARRIVVVRAIRDAADPEAAARELRAALEPRRTSLRPMASRERKRAERRKRKERRADAPRPTQAERQREAMAARSRGQQRGRPRGARAAGAGRAAAVVTIGAVISALIALSAIVGYAAGVEVTKIGSDGIEQGEGEAPLFSVIAVVALMGMMAWGMWRARYWAVLGFQALLVIVIVAASLGLVQATDVAQAVGTRLLIAGAGTLFCFMIKAMARIQMPERRPSE